MSDGWLFNRYVTILAYPPAPRRQRWRAVDVNGDDYCFQEPTWFSGTDLKQYVVLVARTTTRHVPALEYPPSHPPGAGLHSPRSLREP